MKPPVDLMDVVRAGPAAPWSQGGKIPWHDPDFSRRMLAEHLSQLHDAASRRSERIEHHVAWIHTELLAGQPARVLDLGCGPGLYAARLAQLGHRCLGIDCSPASIEYAQDQAAADGLACEYQLADLRTASYGDGHGIALLLFGEINAFRREDARAILARTARALAPAGRLLIEPHPFEAVRRSGRRAPSWYRAASGLFSDAPHLCLRESAWHADQAAATTQTFVVDAASGAIERYCETLQAYTEEEYRSLLEECGFEAVELLASMGDDAGATKDGLQVVLARVPGA